MKRLKKSIAVLALVLMLPAVFLCACNKSGNIVSPADNTDIFYGVQAKVWKEGATKDTRFSYDTQSYTTDNLYSGGPFLRLAKMQLWTHPTDFAGIEFTTLKFTVTSDTDVALTFSITYASDILASKEVTLTANTAAELTFEFASGSFIMSEDDEKLLSIGFDGAPASGTPDFAVWSQIQYKVEGLALYGVEP